MRLKRPTQSRSETVKQLVHAIRSWVDVKTKPEQLFWEQQATDLVQAALQAGKDPTLFVALDTVWEDKHPDAYERLADLIENCVQTSTHDDGTVSLLIAIPVLTWSRNDLPSGQTDATTHAAVKHAVQNHWLAKGVRLNLGHTLYSPDALPDGFVATYKLAQKMFADALQNTDTAHNKSQFSEPDAPFLADCRFWLGVVTAPLGAPIFQAQLNAHGDVHIEAQVAAWRPQITAAAHKLFIGCAYEIMPPEGYYEANRSAELDIRGFSLQASALMMMTTLELPADQIRVIIAPCHSTQFEEYRISLLSKNSPEVLQGVAWPLLGREETQEDLLLEIQHVLEALGITRIRIVEQALSMDYCDDCGTPLFPDLAEELVHPGSPEEDEQTAKHRILH